MTFVQAQVNHCMRVVYRMRGLMGDATEDIIETLDSGSSENVDEEEIYHMADTMSQCGGLEAALTRCVRRGGRERERERVSLPA